MQNSIVVLKGSCLGSKTTKIESAGMIFMKVRIVVTFGMKR